MSATLNWIAHNYSIQVAENRVQKIVRRKIELELVARRLGRGPYKRQPN
jgi:hypothetical protein